jgi:hypothetical protein
MNIRMIGSIFTVAALILTAATGAKADPKERQTQQIAIAGTAISAYLLSREDTRTYGAVAAAGTAYAWKKHSDAVNSRHQRQAAYAYRAGHQAGQRVASSNRGSSSRVSSNSRSRTATTRRASTTRRTAARR